MSKLASADLDGARFFSRILETSNIVNGGVGGRHRGPTPAVSPPPFIWFCPCPRRHPYESLVPVLRIHYHHHHLHLPCAPWAFLCRWWISFGRCLICCC